MTIYEYTQAIYVVYASFLRERNYNTIYSLYFLCAIDQFTRPENIFFLFERIFKGNSNSNTKDTHSFVCISQIMIIQRWSSTSVLYNV